MLTLTSPTTALHTQWLAARDDWGRGVHQPGSGLRPGDDIDSPAGFADWVARLHREGDENLPPATGLVHAGYWWITDQGGAVLGTISLRYALTDFLLQAAGHIGYGIRPSARGHGIAGWALTETLKIARQRALTPILITCDQGNAASARVIEKHGGTLEDVRDTSVGLKRRYWITLSPGEWQP
ncbi:GNAT family N-acetyltransferase [Actinoplanes derwentensis]|uniref:Predicted acetyltransferase n=1 Tax=Actinoplanes derwentensis TaxID=113562 RepID=A0A1H1WEG1_9ACTN|nr:GNAT family N-acetyltransferase [Actinoplanes derwentensis]GID87413.1 acetyltransferase [Actinoplanes derwentensis]SDS95768.1 Predicted acetyltransferase [Actinoplanes derwentensis]